MRVPRALLASTVVALACQADEPLHPTSERPSFAVSDGAHSGNGGFHFLPPLVPQPSYSGTFDGSLSPVVEICEWTGTGCVTPLLAVFTTTSGPGSERVRVMPEDELYIVNWRTSRFTGKPAKIYRIFVRVGPLDLGYADVNVVRSLDEGRNVGSDGSLVVVAGATVPIKFRIENGAVASEERIAAFDGARIVTDDDGNQLVVNQLLVTFTDEVTVGTAVSLIRSVGGTIVGFFSPPASYQVELPVVFTLEQLQTVTTALRNSVSVFAVVEGYLLTDFRSTEEFDVERLELARRWAYERIRLADAWHAIRRAQNENGLTLSAVKIAIIDDGLFKSHNEFDDVAAMPGFPFDDDWTDGAHHGTPVAGIIGADDGDGHMSGVLGPAGVGAIEFYIYKVDQYDYQHNDDRGYVIAMLHAVNDAATRGIHVLNMSCCGLRGLSATARDHAARTLDRLVREAPATVFVVAAGNDALSEFEQWPATIDAPNFARIGATDHDDQRVASSNGSSGMLAAPGEDIYVPSNLGASSYWWYDEDERRPFGQTSAAAPFVAGVAALVRMVAQQSLTGGSILQAIRSKSQQVSVTLPDRSTGTWFLIDACATVAAVGITCPVVQEPAVPVFKSVTAGRAHTCALATTGHAYCWGSGSHGQIGVGSFTDVVAPRAVNGGLLFTSLSAGVDHSCGVTVDNQAYCWGSNLYGQLGNGEASSRSAVPVAVLGGHRFSAVEVFGQATCGMTPEGAAYCWGRDELGELGDIEEHEPCLELIGVPVGRCSKTPVPVSGGLTFRSIDAACGITDDGSLYCWGPSPSAYNFTPVLVSESLRFRSASRGGGHTCGVAANDLSYCWGRNVYGELGTGSPSPDVVTAPAVVSTAQRFSRIAVNKWLMVFGHTCALTQTGTAYCWGSNVAGQLGTGSTVDQPVPVPVSGGIRFAGIAGGDMHTCGVSIDGVAYCWGRNYAGQLGSPVETSLVPVRVSNPE